MHAQPARRRPSASLVISVIALFVALSGPGRAASLSQIILGKTNHATRTTGIAGNLANQVLALTNTGTGPAASFTTSTRTPPFAVNSSIEVRNLNASSIAGHSPSDFWQLGGNALTNPDKQILGTSNAKPLELGVAGQPIMSIDPDGNVRVGATAAPSASSPQLDVAAIGVHFQDAIHGTSGGGDGVDGASTSATGVGGTSQSGFGVHGLSSSGEGVRGESTSADGVLGTSQGASGVGGVATSGNGVSGVATSGIGVFGKASCAGACNPCPTNAGVVGCAGADDSGVIGAIDHPAGGGTAAAIEAVNQSNGDLFLGIVGSGQQRVARIDGAGKGYFDGGTQDSGADYADAMREAPGASLAPGDVLAIDPARPGAVALARASDAALVAGVYSTRPAVLGTGAARAAGTLRGRVPVALVGVVPTRVSAENGPVEPGDLLTAARTPGYAMKAKPVEVGGAAVYPTGTILGKALQPLRSGTGLIEVLVTLR